MSGRRSKGRWWRGAIAGIAVVGALFLAASFYVEFRYAGRIQTRAQVPPSPVAVVFGAGLEAGGEPSPVLRQRVDAAMALYRAGKVKKLLVSGDNTDRYHDETKAMRRYAIDRGLPSADVVGDYAGVSTYDTLYRAREIFGVREAILVTQEFHLPRALFIAHALGIDAWGVPADPETHRIWRYEVRELFARAFTVYQALAQPPARILGPRESMNAGPADARDVATQ